MRGSHLRALLATAVLVALTSSAAGQAAPRPARSRPDRIRVGIFVVPTRDQSPHHHTHLVDVLDRALTRERRITVVDIDRQLAARAGAIPEERISEARGLLRSGEVLLRKGRAAEGLVRLETAESHLGRSLSFVSKRELARAQFLVGAANAVLGRTDAATAAFVRLKVWRPEFVADTSLAPAKVLPLWQAAESRVERHGGGSIELASSPSGALVYIDGTAAGMTPTTIEGLIVGRHYVTFEQAGHRRTVTEVEVSASAQRAVTAELEPSTGYGQVRELVTLIGPSLGAAKGSPEVGRLGELLTIEHALFVRVPEQRGEPFQALLYHTGTNERLASATAADGDSEAALGELVRTLYAGLVLVPKPEARPQTPPVATRPRSRRWWLWAGLAAGVTAVAVPLLLSTGGEASPICPAGSRCGEVILDF